VLLLILLLSSDTLYTCEFSEYHPGWTAGSYWSWQAECIELEMSVYLDPMSFMVEERDTLLSPPIPVPWGWSNLTLVVENTRHRYGYYSSPGYSQTTTAIDASAASWDDELWRRMINQSYYDDIDTEPIIVTIPLAQPCDTLSLRLWGWVYCTRIMGGGTAKAELEWGISRISVIGESVPLEQDTWASIKASF